jgi:hypothetical protein
MIEFGSAFPYHIFKPQKFVPFYHARTFKYPFKIPEIPDWRDFGHLFQSGGPDRTPLEKSRHRDRFDRQRGGRIRLPNIRFKGNARAGLISIER